MPAATRHLFAQDVDDQRFLEQNALSPLNWPGTSSPYTRLFASAAYTDFATMENRIRDGARPGARIPVSPAAWQSGVLAAVHELADQRLPLVVRRLRQGERVDIAAEAPPLTLRASTREVTKIAEAFSAVQRTAVGEAELRAAASVVYRSLARHSQSLVQQQLDMLDSMERDASDPNALEQLFSLDHLTTRMRRHAEGLIVLSGAPSGRRWRDPVPLVEVLRGAIGEIEDYTRVDLTASADVLVAGGAVADVAHLLAELIENAANYSPPGTRVTVGAGLTANGLAIEVEDRGLGISPQTLAALNDRPANPPDFSLADTDQLGLLVVSRLAARQEIAVSLRGSPYGGTSAIVLLPHRIVVRQQELAGRPSPADTGLPRRSPQSNPAPQHSNDQPRRSTAVDGQPVLRSADQARALITSIRRGWQNGSTETDQAQPTNDANDEGHRHD